MSTTRVARSLRRPRSGANIRRVASAVMITSLTAGAVAAVPAAAAASTPDVAVTWSSEDGTYRLTDRPSSTLEAEPAGAPDVTINVDPQVEFQEVLGWGGVLESTSVYNIAHLSPDNRDEVMELLFDPVDGNGYSLVRLTMGCPDMCAGAFRTYDDVPAGETDEDLSGFSIQADIDEGIVDLALQARQINPDVRFYMSMWSAPAWMKTNESLIGGGSLKTEYYGVLARYQRMAVEAYQAAGIPIIALTPQNEPHVVMPYPTMEWTGEQMRDYIAGHLGPELRQAGLATEIWVGDDNLPALRDFVPTVLDDPEAAQYVDGVAIHDYAGESPENLQDFRIRYPDLPVYLTERSYYGINGEAHGVSGDIQLGVRRLIDFLRNGVGGWSYWITFLDSEGGPSTGPLDASCCAVPFLAPAGDLDSFTVNRDHYLYGQLTRYVSPGAVRVSSDQNSSSVGNIAFRNPDGSLAVVVANGKSVPQVVSIASPDGVITDTIPAMTVGTYRWQSAVAATDPVPGVVRFVNTADGEAVLQSTGDLYAPWADAYHTATSPSAWNSAEQRWVITSAGEGYYRITSLARPFQVLHTAHENYLGYVDVWNTATTVADLGWDDQLWAIEPVGDGSYRVINKARGTALQKTGETYGSFADVFETVSSPVAWDIPEQKWLLVRD